MKTYLIPALKVEEAQAAQMLAVSLGINGDHKVSGNDALTKEDVWDIFDDEE